MFSDDSFVITYADLDSSTGKFVIYNSDRTVKKAITEFTAETVLGTKISILSNDNFIIMYKRGGSTRFIMYDSGGTEIKSDTLLWLSPSDLNLISICKLSNDNFVMAAGGTSGSGISFTIYDSSGNLVKPKTQTGYSGDYISLCPLSNDNFIISYANIPDEGKFIIYDKDGNMVRDEAEFDVGATSYISSGASSTDALHVAYVDGGDSSKGKVYKNTISTLYWTGITVSAAATVNGITFDAEDQQYLARMFDGSAKLTHRFCEIKGVTNPWDTDNGWAVYTSSEVDAQNNSIHDNACGIYTAENTATVKYNLFYRNTGGYACHIKGTAASGDDIDVQHNTFFRNYNGLQLEDNGGTNETVKNNIFSEQDVYDLVAETAMTTTYSIIAESKCTNVTAGTGCTAANPLFRNTGDSDEDDTDLMLMMRIMGDYGDSPAYQLSDDSAPDRDAGAWDVIIIGEATTWSSFLCEKPATGLQRTIEFVGATETVKKSGDIETDFTGMIETILANHEGIRNAEALNWLTALSSSSNLLKFTPNPTTYPDTYQLFKKRPKAFNYYAKSWLNDDDFKEKLNVQFSRKFELA
jgi:hypothetical protein